MRPRPIRSPYVRNTPPPPTGGLESFFELPRLVEDLRKRRDDLDAKIAQVDSVIADAKKAQKGDVGPRGPQGFSIKGPRGEKGDAGPQGPKGDKGEPGVSALGEAVDLEGVGLCDG